MRIDFTRNNFILRNNYYGNKLGELHKGNTRTKGHKNGRQF